MRKGIDELKKKYVKSLLEWHHGHKRRKDWGVESIRVLLRLSEVKGPNAFVSRSEFQQHGIPYGIGRWPESGVVEKAEGRRAYRIKDIFYKPTKQALIEYDREHSQQMR